MKKQYISPTTEVVKIPIKQDLLLVVSGKEADGDANAPEWDFDFFEDEE